MKRLMKVIVVVIWLALIYVLFKLNLINGDTNKLNDFINEYKQYKVIVFLLLSTLRIVVFIPSAVFMVLGGVLFSPMNAIVLTMCSVIFSETIVYYLSRIFVGTKLQAYIVAKHPKLSNLLQNNNVKILAMGILCPIAPSDVLCFLARSTGIKYISFILTVILSNLPMILLYSFLGNSVINSANDTIVILAMVCVISAYTVYLWRKEQKQYETI